MRFSPFSDPEARVGADPGAVDETGAGLDFYARLSESGVAT